MGRVLVVDDNPSDRMVAQTLLGTMRVSVETADSGFAALEKLDEQEPFDLLLVDLSMPQMSGLELMKRIRRNSNWCDIPIVVLSGRNEESDVRLGIKGGARDYITKPIDHEIFKKKLAKFISTDEEKWTEYEIEAGSKGSKASLLLRSECRVEKISEIGGVIESDTNLKVGCLLQVELDIFKESGIGAVSIRIDESHKKDSKFYLRFAFVGLTDEKNQEIRSFCQKIWRDNKNQKSQA